MYTTIALAIGICVALFQLVAPIREKQAINEYILSQNKKKYAVYEFLSIIPLFLFIGIQLYAFYVAGNYLQSLIQPDEGVLFFYQPQPLAWLLPGIGLSSGLIMIPMTHLYKALLKDEYEIYLEYTNRKHGYDGMKIMRPISIIMFTIGCITVMLMLNTSLSVTDSFMHVNRFLSLTESEIPIDEIDQVTHFTSFEAPNGKIVERDRYVLYSSRIQVWDTDNSFIEDEALAFESLIQYIAERNGLSVEETAVFRE